MAANKGLILHHAVANGSLYNFFNNPSSEVSAHFWVSKTGVIEQYVDSSVVAWHAMQLNDTYCGVETEGCTDPPDYAEPMTSAMVDALARLYAEGHERHGWPNELANYDGQNGFGYHRMAVPTACPCDVRLSMRNEILTKAFNLPPGATPDVPLAGVPPLHVDYFGPAYGHNHAVPDVRTWQQKMQDRGWPIAVDQIYGPHSDQTCREFQQEKGLKVDGLVGPQTWSATWTAPIT
jgi:hypothetical protein